MWHHLVDLTLAREYALLTTKNKTCNTPPGAFTLACATSKYMLLTTYTKGFYHPYSTTPGWPPQEAMPPG